MLAEASARPRPGFPCRHCASRKDRDVEASPLRTTRFDRNDRRRAVSDRLDRRRTFTYLLTRSPRSAWARARVWRGRPPRPRAVSSQFASHNRASLGGNDETRRFRSELTQKNAPRSPSRHNTTVPSPWALKSRASPPGTGSPSPSPARPSPRTTWVRAGPTRPRCPRNLPIFATRALWRFLPPDSRDREDGRQKARVGPRCRPSASACTLASRHDSPSDPTPHPHPRSASPVHQARSRTGASLTAPATKVAPSSLSSASAR